MIPMYFMEMCVFVIICILYDPYVLYEMTLAVYHVNKLFFIVIAIATSSSILYNTADVLMWFW